MTAPSHRFAAAVLAAGAVAAGAMAAAAPASAATRYVAIAYSPGTHVSGWANGYDNLDGAHVRALNECNKAGGSHCVTVTWSRNGCAALAVRGDNYYGWYGATRAAAEQEALRRNSGGYIAVSKCATN